MPFQPRSLDDTSLDLVQITPYAKKYDMKFELLVFIEEGAIGTCNE